MTVNINYLDLTQTVWSPQEFEENDLKVADGRTNQFIYQKKPEEARSSKSWGASVLDGIKYWTGAGESNPLFAVSENLNKIADKILHGEHLIAQDAYIASFETTEKRLAAVKEAFQHLENLRRNLENHDVIVKAYNERFIFKEKLVGCPTHQKALQEINEELSKLGEMQFVLQLRIKDTQREAVKDFNKQLDQLENNLENGLKIDKDVILRAYPQLLEKAKKLGIKEDDPSIRRMQYLLNSYYIANLIDKISQQQMPIPSSIELLLDRMNLSESLKKQMTEEGRKELIAKLQQILKDRSLLEKPSPDFVRQIQQDFLGIAMARLAAVQPELANLAPLIEKLYFFENEALQTAQKAELETRAEIEELFKALPKGTKLEELTIKFLIDKWRAQAFPPLVPRLLERFFDQIDLKALPRSDDAEGWKKHLEDLEKVFDKAQREGSINAMKIQLDRAVIKPFMKDALSYIEKQKQPWFERNAQARCFAYEQGAWGDQQVFGRGVCAAINYRWIRNLLQHPAKKVRSAEDLGHEEKREKDFIQRMMESSVFKRAAEKGVEKEEVSGVTARDRMDHAATGVGLKLAPKYGVYRMEAHILKRDHLKFTEVKGHQTTIDKLIDNIVKNHPDTLGSNLTNGIFAISAYQVQGNESLKGHALGMQIDPLNGIYRFWDVNSGFYQYSSLEEMKEEFARYMEEFYSGDFNVFDAGQYSPAI